MKTIYDKIIAREVSKQLLEIGAVTFNTKKPYRFVSGILSPMYTDNRLLISYPKQWRRVIAAYVAVLKKTKLLANIDCFSGTATAAISHAAAIAYMLRRPMVYVRSSKKDHGKGNQIEGTFPKKSNVLIVEDLVSTGLSIRTNCVAVREAGGVAKTCIAITTSTVSAFDKIIKELKIRLITLTDVQTTLEVAVATKRISPEQKQSVELFLADPAEWGRKMGFE
jgi:orotate phosphoribosyltransferase